MKKILYLPLDERPCNYVFPQYIAEIGAAEMVCAPKSLMGSFKKPADIDALWEWTYENAKHASHIILSTDLMLYGGIVPSRLHHFTREQCDIRIESLNRLHEKFPDIKIYAFGLITRAPAYSSSDEEPDYYANCGLEINRFGVLNDKKLLCAITQPEEAELEELTKKIPTENMLDFKTRREINLESHFKIISLFSQGVMDTLVIPLDDCKPHGWASRERRALSRFAAEKGVLSRVLMYPGADEIGCVLTARAVCDIYGKSPQIFTDWASNSGKLTVPSFEDRTIGETAPYHILACGAIQAPSVQSADAALCINPPTEFSQRVEAAADRREINMEAERNIPAFLQRANGIIKYGIPCFLADCAVPNGAETSLMVFLKEIKMLGVFSGYSGWNTSSNALGTASAHAVAYAAAKSAGAFGERQQAASDKFRLMRYIEDWGYMTNIRAELTGQLSQFGEGLSYFTLCDKNDEVSARLTDMLQRFADEKLQGFSCKITARFPWNRMFEIALEID